MLSLKSLQENGLPLIFVRNKQGEPSVTLTAVVVGLGLCVAALLGVDNINFDHALNFYITSMLLYLGRGFQKSGIKVEDK